MTKPTLNLNKLRDRIAALKSLIAAEEKKRAKPLGIQCQFMNRWGRHQTLVQCKQEAVSKWILPATAGKKSVTVVACFCPRHSLERA